LKRKRTKIKGKFIVFEGGHGSGKTTQAKMLVKYLQDNGMRARYTKEPYGDDLIPLISKYSDDLLDSPVLMYLLAASRCIHVRDIKCWIANGEFVVCDRYILSSLVYQQIQGIPLKVIKNVNSFSLKPYATFYVKAPLKARLRRLCNTHRDRKSFFLKNSQLDKEQNLYDGLVHRWNKKRYGRIVTISGEASSAKVHESIVNHLVSEIK
jgi:dTMP kinase